MLPRAREERDKGEACCLSEKDVPAGPGEGGRGPGREAEQGRQVSRCRWAVITDEDSGGFLAVGGGDRAVGAGGQGTKKTFLKTEILELFICQGEGASR